MSDQEMPNLPSPLGDQLAHEKSQADILEQVDRIAGKLTERSCLIA